MNSISIESVSEFINEKAVLQSDLVNRIAVQKAKIQKQKKFTIALEQSAEILRNVARETQQQVKYKISEAGTLALQSVFENDCEIDVNFITKRNQTECEINFKKGDQLYSPMDEDGFGTADIAGFGLRVAIWSLPAQRSRKVIIMDEPFKHLKGREANIAAIQAVKKISDSLGLQIIMISDERVDFDQIEKGADRVFKVEMTNNESKVKVIK